jgi:hypothetical protein
MAKFQPGRSGNPRGRPRGRTIRDAIRAALAEASADNPERSRLEALAERLVREAEGGQRDALELFRFLEGPSPQPGESLSEPCDEPRPRIVIPTVDRRYARSGSKAGASIENE